MRFRSLSLPRLSEVCQFFDDEIHDVEITELKSGDWCIRLQFTVEHPPIAAIAENMQLCERRLLKMFGTVGISLAELRIQPSSTQAERVVEQTPSHAHSPGV